MGTPHNEATPGAFAKTVLMPGDPLRAKYVAEHYLENPVCFNTVRNMLGYTGTYKGKKISVMGHGMGVPSMGIYATELYTQFDVDAIIRIGSAGGIGDDVKVRDVVIAMGASTNSHFADQYGFPGLLAPTASRPLLRSAVREVRSGGDRGVGYVQLPECPQSGLGSREHPGRGNHRSAALVVVRYLKKMLERKTEG